MKVIRTLLLLVVLCFGVAPVLFAQQESSAADAGVASSDAGDSGTSLDGMGVRKYRLGPGDVLDLRVFGEPQFNDKLQVTDEGFVEVAFIGPVPARCRTDVEVKRDIVKALAKYLKNPQVSLRLTEARSRPPATVFGAVRASQRVDMRRKARLLDLLAFAGGVTDQAGGVIQVFHTEPVMCPEFDESTPSIQKTADDLTQAPFNLYNLSDTKMGKDEANPYIRPGDLVIVQEASPVYVVGAVVSPQPLPLRENLLLTRAIAMVGGLRREAKASSIRVYRVKPGTQEQEVLTVDFNAIRKQKREDFALKPYDVVEVTDNSGSFINMAKGFLTGGISNAVSGTAMNLPVRIMY